MTQDRKAYRKAYYEAHKDQAKANMKAWYESHKDQYKAYMKAYYKAHKEEAKANMKAWRASHKEQYRNYQKGYKEAHKDQANEYMKAYNKSDVNSLGQTKQSIRKKSLRILKRMNLHIDGYEIHHCFGYEDPFKFIYISKALHRTIHQYLREHNIDASCDHWMAIRDLVNSTDEFTYIKC